MIENVAKRKKAHDHLIENKIEKDDTNETHTLDKRNSVDQSIRNFLL